MISKANADILKAVQANGNVVFSDQMPATFTPLRMDDLVALGLLHRVVHPSGIIVYQLLPAGEDALSNLAEERIRRASDKAAKDLQNKLQNEQWRKDARRSWVQFTITTVLSVAAFFTGAIVEVFTGFMQWVIRLFH